jgi:ABC-2 type transport system permease protein
MMQLLSETSFTRILALLKRNILLTFRGINPMIDIFYWPFYDILLWGFASAFFQYQSDQPISAMWLTGLVIWQASYRCNLDVSFTLLSELWTRNIVNLFGTPVGINEWIISTILLGAFDTLITLAFSSTVVYLFYGVKVFAIGWIFVPMLLLLMLSGWSIGFFSAGCLIYWGQKVEKIVWVLGWMFVPVSALFYPLSTLPGWAVAIAKALPMSYVFEGLRSYITTGVVPTSHLLTALGMNLVYLTLSLTFFKVMYHQSRVKGLSRLEAE